METCGFDNIVDVAVKAFAHAVGLWCMRLDKVVLNAKFFTETEERASAGLALLVLLS